MKRTALMATMALACTAAMAQTAYTGQYKNFIPTGMPILLIAPDAISGAMGDVGAATTPDVYSAHWNNAKFAFIDGNMGAGLTFTPWMRNLHLNDMNLYYLSGYYRINSRSTMAAGLTYFTLGEIDHTNESGDPIGTLKPNEFAIDVTYSLKLTDKLALGATGRYIKSDLTNGAVVDDGAGSHTNTNPARSLAADVGLYYQTAIDKTQDLALGAFISNLGAKLSYSEDDTDKEFLPANLRLGARYTNHVDEYNKISLMMDVNKLLVPTPPITTNGQNHPTPFASNGTEYNNIGVVEGAFQSFVDAPGGFAEEVQELQISVGAEYWYVETFAVRAGYFYEHANKGGRQYATLGVGVKYNVFNFDFAYLVPTTKIATNPLSNTIRIGVTMGLKPTK